MTRRPPRLPCPRLGSSHRLAEAARAWDDIPCLRIVGEVELQFGVPIIGQVLGQELREERRLDELHARAIIYATCV